MDKLSTNMKDIILSSIKTSLSKEDLQKTLDLLLKRQDFDTTILLIDILTDYDPDNENLLFLKAMLLLENNHLDKSEDTLSKATSLSKAKQNEETMRECDLLLKKIKSQKDLIKFMDVKLSQFGKDYEPTDLAATKEDLVKRQVAINRGTPSILMISVARAGSSTIIRQIAKITKTPRVEVASERTPIEHDMALGYLYDFSRGGGVTYVHSRANKKNLHALSESQTTKFILHLRDPRQAFLSNYYRMHAEKSWIYNRVYYNDLPIDYDQKSFSEQIDWQIENVYQRYWLSWIEEWCDIAEDKNNKFDIKIITFEEFKKNPIAYYQSIVDFYGLDRSDYPVGNMVDDTIRPPTEVKGRLDYWRDKFNSNQIDKLQSMTPDSLLEKFNWPR